MFKFPFCSKHLVTYIPYIFSVKEQCCFSYRFLMPTSVSSTGALDTIKSKVRFFRVPISIAFTLFTLMIFTRSGKNLLHMVVILQQWQFFFKVFPPPFVVCATQNYQWSPLSHKYLNSKFFDYDLRQNAVFYHLELIKI